MTLSCGLLGTDCDLTENLHLFLKWVKYSFFIALSRICGLLETDFDLSKNLLFLKSGKYSSFIAFS